jgi:hypothetical protein
MTTNETQLLVDRENDIERDLLAAVSEFIRFYDAQRRVGIDWPAQRQAGFDWNTNSGWQVFNSACSIVRYLLIPEEAPDDVRRICEEQYAHHPRRSARRRAPHLRGTVCS